MLNEVDLNKNGQVELDEFLQVSLRVFSSLISVSLLTKAIWNEVNVKVTYVAI